MYFVTERFPVAVLQYAAFQPFGSAPTEIKEDNQTVSRIHWVRTLFLPFISQNFKCLSYRKCKSKLRSLLCLNKIKPVELSELLLNLTTLAPHW